MALLDTMGLKRCPGTILGTTSDQLVHIAGAKLNLAAARLIPDNVYILGHVCAAHSLAGFRVITIFRDPRNCLVSYLRHRKREDGLDVSIAEALDSYWGSPFVEVYAGFLGWRGHSVVCRYEDLDPATCGEGAGIYQAPQKDWNTRTGAPSRWQDVWDEEAEAAWLAHEGPALLKAAGYIERET